MSLLLEFTDFSPISSVISERDTLVFDAHVWRSRLGCIRAAPSVELPHLTAYPYSDMTT